MKTSIRLLSLAGLLLGSAIFTFAESSKSTYETLRSEEQFKQLKPGDKIAYVCNQCKTVSEVTIKSVDQTMEFCKEGATLMCPSCKTKVKITTKGPPKNQSIQREVTYTNEKGEECLFVVKVSEHK